MPLQLLLAWWNLIYIVPFTLALFYLGLFVFTGITFGDTDMDADADVDADATVQVEAHVVDVDGDADVDADHDASVEHDADAHTGGLVHAPGGAALLAHEPVAAAHDAENGGESPFISFLTMLGIGKIPLSLALMILLMSWGIVGFALNALLAKWLSASGLIALISMPLTFIISLALTGLCAAAIAKIIPNDEGIRQRRCDLVGKAGEAIYDIDASFGMANVRGDGGDLFQVPCRTATGKPAIKKGTRIVLFHYDSEKGVFQAAPFDA